MRKMLVLSAALLLSALLPSSATADFDCRGDIAKIFFCNLPVIGDVAAAADSFIAELRKRGSQEDVINHATSLAAWDNPFYPAQPAPSGHFQNIQYRCTQNCGCQPRNTEPVLVKQGTDLMFFNECGQSSRGAMLSLWTFTPGGPSLSAGDWHLTVKVIQDGKILHFSNDTIWVLR
jgi:hypothetical protein